MKRGGEMGELWGGTGYLTGQVEGPEKIDLKEALARSISSLAASEYSHIARGLASSARPPSPVLLFTAVVMMHVVRVV